MNNWTELNIQLFKSSDKVSFPKCNVSLNCSKTSRLGIMYLHSVLFRLLIVKLDTYSSSLVLLELNSAKCIYCIVSDLTFHAVVFLFLCSHKLQFSRCNTHHSHPICDSRYASYTSQRLPILIFFFKIRVKVPDFKKDGMSNIPIIWYKIWRITDNNPKSTYLKCLGSCLFLFPYCFNIKLSFDLFQIPPQ